MNRVFYFILLACLAICNLDLANGQEMVFRRPHRPPRPPPPFDIPQPYPPPFRWRPRTEPPSTPTPASSTMDDSTVILYKLQCDPCLPGWGVKSMCNSTSNTVCTPCPLGTWSPRTHHYRPCTSCSKCGEGSYEETACVTTRDTVCCSCGNSNAKINDDYLRKCLQMPDTGSNEHELDMYDWDMVDVKSKEMEKSEASYEWNIYDDNIDRAFLWLPEKRWKEEDITLDDPEIDSELPKEDEEDYSKEEEETWKKIMQNSWKTTKEGKEGDVMDQTEIDDMKTNEEQILEPIRIQLRPVRPFPQFVPPAEDNIQMESDEDPVSLSETPAENNFPPSYHEYSLSSLIHAGDAQRRKAIVLLVLTCAIVLSTVFFVVCYAREYCKRRSSNYSGVMVVNLTPEEREIIRKSAQLLETVESPMKGNRNSGAGYSSMRKEEGDTVVYMTENPLEEYLNATDERHLARKGLIENEVTEDSRMKKSDRD